MTGILNTLLAAGGFKAVQHVYNTAGSGSDIIPIGATTQIIEAWGSGGSGGADNAGGPAGGGGGGSGGYVRSSNNVSGQGGKTTNYSVPAAASGNATVSSGTFAITIITASQGTNGSAATGVGGAGGAGGAASGGNVVNTTGNAGSVGNTGTLIGGPGGAALVGLNSNSAGAGGHGITGSPAAAAGQIIYTYF